MCHCICGLDRCYRIFSIFYGEKNRYFWLDLMILYVVKELNYRVNRDFEKDSGSDQSVVCKRGRYLLERWDP